MLKYSSGQWMHVYAQEKNLEMELILLLKIKNNKNVLPSCATYVLLRVMPHTVRIYYRNQSTIETSYTCYTQQYANP